MKKQNLYMDSQEYKVLDNMWFKLRQIEFINEGDWRLKLDFLANYILILAIHSEVQLVADGRTVVLERGTAFICSPGQLVKVSTQTFVERGFFIIWFDVLVDAEDSSVKDIHLSNFSLFPLIGESTIATPAAMGELSETVYRYWQSSDSLEHLQAQAQFQMILCMILQDARKVEPENDVNTAVHQTKFYMEGHYYKNLKIDELADLAGVSRYHYMRTFKLLYGKSVMDYLLEWRITQAKLRMSDTKIPLREIAKQVGFNDEYYFIRKFKQLVGIPPALYVKNRQRKIAAYSFPNIGQLLALSIVPYAAPLDHSWTDLYRKKYQADVFIPLSHDYDFNREALQLAAPDYIIGIDEFVPEAEQMRLQQIAPALFVPWLTCNWREHLQIVAEFLDKSMEAGAYLEDYERKVKLIQAKLTPMLRIETVLVLQITGENYCVFGKRSIAGVLYEDLQLGIPDNIAQIESFKQICIDELNDYDADRILIMTLNNSTAQTNWEVLQRTEQWQELKAVRSKRIRVIPGSYNVYEYSAFTQAKFLEEALNILEA